MVSSHDAELPGVSAALSDLKSRRGRDTRRRARRDPLRDRRWTASRNYWPEPGRRREDRTRLADRARAEEHAGRDLSRHADDSRCWPDSRPVPVELTVYGWTLPDLADYGTSVSLLHCPESSSRIYKVPLWSDKHFALIEKSMILMGYAGNTLLSVPVLGEDVFGDQPLIVFRKVDNRIVPDFRYAKRYLELYARHAAAPRQLVAADLELQVSARGFGRDGGKKKWIAETIKVRMLQGERLVPAEIPTYGRPGTEETWRLVATGIRQIVKDLGWTRTQAVVGHGRRQPAERGDHRVLQEGLARLPLAGGDPRRQHRPMGRRTGRRRAASWSAMPISCGGTTTAAGSGPRRPLDSLKRDGVTSCPIDYLTMAPLGRIAANYSGTGFLSFDGWSWEGGNGRRRPDR